VTAKELYDAGRLTEAIQAQTQEVKARPADPDARAFLFALLCFAGELERASRQLDALITDGSESEAATWTFRQLLTAEAERRSVFREGTRPLLPPDPPADLEHRLRCLASLAAGDVPEAERALDAANDAAVEVGGKLNGEGFEAIRDTDDFVASLLEVFAGGRYLWLPFEQIRRLEIASPRRVLDLLWAPATLEDVRGTEANVYLPVLYEASHEHDDEAIRLGRTTEWLDARGVGQRGAGQRVLLRVGGEGEAEVGLLEIRNLELAQAP